MKPPKVTILATFEGGTQKRFTGIKARLLIALKNLGPIGIAQGEIPILRLSRYVAHLRKIGVDITTELERSRGFFQGTHARYFLRSSLSLEVICPPQNENPPRAQSGRASNQTSSHNQEHNDGISLSE